MKNLKVNVSMLSLVICLCYGGFSAAEGPGHFVGMLQLEPGEDGRHMTLLANYEYVDGNGKRWPVPKGEQTDGASIPQAFWSIAGGPFEGKYRNAAVIHDWYCDTRTEPWHDVDRMLYEAMLTSGVSEQQAKIMYLAVVYGGPRWDAQTINNNRLAAGQLPLAVPTPVDPTAVVRNTVAPSQREPRTKALTNQDLSHWRDPIKLNPPDAAQRLRDMVKKVGYENLSPDDIDKLAEQDPENIRYVPPPAGVR
jgi:Protein of unknown function (DUF1353)